MLKVAFVGMKRSPYSMDNGYWPTFVKYHLELPYYYAKYSNCQVDLITTENIEYNEIANLKCISEKQFLDEKKQYDVVVHWRKWFDEFYVSSAKNVILSQDHSFSNEWKQSVYNAYNQKKLYGILVFPTWHKENTSHELSGLVPKSVLYEGMTLGVDTSVYFPYDKDPYSLLWASDPGRGLDKLIPIFIKLRKADARFKLTVTYPDYVKPENVAKYSQFFSFPGVIHKPTLRNGKELQDLFNSTAFLPYTSTFPEPSSRCHRQAMASGCVVLYPENMGTPSYLIKDKVNGFVRPLYEWHDIIIDVINKGLIQEIGSNARELAISEDWRIQAERFYSFFKERL